MNEQFNRKPEAEKSNGKGKPDKILGMIGLATRAGKAVSGEFSVDEAIKAGKAYLVIAAEDASDRTKKTFGNRCKYRNVPLIFYSDKETLGHSVGKDYRSLVAITDPGFAGSIQKLFL